MVQVKGEESFLENEMPHRSLRARLRPRGASAPEGGPLGRRLLRGSLFPGFMLPRNSYLFYIFIPHTGLDFVNDLVFQFIFSKT